MILCFAEIWILVRNCVIWIFRFLVDRNCTKCSSGGILCMCVI